MITIDGGTGTILHNGTNYKSGSLIQVVSTEKTDAIALVVSEENGKISYIKNGKFINYSNIDNLLNIIEKDIS